LRLLARTVHHLWRIQPPDAYSIHAHHMDPAFEPIRTEINVKLGQGQYAPAVKSDVAAVAGDAKVTLTWDAVSGAASYNVYWATATGVRKGTGTRIANASSPYVHQGLANGTTYYYAVTAGNASGEGDASQEVSAKPQFPILSIVLGSVNQSDGIKLDSGGDTDTAVVVAGSPPQEARISGNGKALPARDGNSVPDFFLQFNVDDVRFYAGSPTAHVQVEVDYLDQGTDTFSIQYDATPSAGGDGLFLGGGAVIKTGPGVFRTAVFNLCDAYFANRDTGANANGNADADADFQWWVNNTGNLLRAACVIF
jgi:hypothetical protein